ncbi:MAG: HutP family protein [Firmicutes bacterium]|nr:HutP family protein [Bacillota bacterium]
MEYGSKDVCKAAIRIALTDTRAEEAELKDAYSREGIKCAAVDFGSDFASAVPKILERAVVAAKRENIIGASHADEGAVAGAAHEALQQIVDKCVGLNLGGKIGIARCNSHISVCIFLEIGLLNLNDVTIAMRHRAVKNKKYEYRRMGIWR